MDIPVSGLLYGGQIMALRPAQLSAWQWQPAAADINRSLRDALAVCAGRNAGGEIVDLGRAGYAGWSLVPVGPPPPVPRPVRWIQGAPRLVCSLAADGLSVQVDWLVPDIEMAVARQMALRDIAAHRWQLETGGIAVSGGRLATDDRSKTLLLGARDLAALAPDRQFDVKLSNGFLRVPAAAIADLAILIGEWVQACFAAEAMLAAEIQSAQTPYALAALANPSVWAAAWPDPNHFAVGAGARTGGG